MNVLKFEFGWKLYQRGYQGGIGGVIYGYDGVRIRNYLGTVGVYDANEAEIYSLLISCRELKRLFGFKTIVEGDSHLAILWGSYSGEYSWHLADLEEIHSLFA